MNTLTIASLMQRRHERHPMVVRLADDTMLLYQSDDSALVLLFPAWLAQDATEWTLHFIATMRWLILVVCHDANWSMSRLLVWHDVTRQ